LRVLLDTHTWLWLLSEPQRIERSTLDILESPGNDLYLSAASTWEVAIKYANKRLALPGDPSRMVPEWMANTDARPLPVEISHTLVVAALPLHHRDPFDRMLIAQSRIEEMPIVTRDPAFDAYEVEVIRA
jgi:PIN domain nuclease of toxin-antitoxin system